jgi:hypothetical protein
MRCALDGRGKTHRHRRPALTHEGDQVAAPAAAGNERPAARDAPEQPKLAASEGGATAPGVEPPGPQPAHPTPLPLPWRALPGPVAVAALLAQLRSAGSSESRGVPHRHRGVGALAGSLYVVQWQPAAMYCRVATAYKAYANPLSGSLALLFRRV